MTLYSEYHRDRVGWFFGLRGWQLVTIAAGSLPVFGAVQRAAWVAALMAAGGWLLLVVVVAVPVRGRSAAGWLTTAVLFAIAGRLGWTRWRSQVARGRGGDADQADLPGVLHPVQVHDGPPHGPTLARVAVIQNHAARTWAVTAHLTHPGIGLADQPTRDSYGRGLTDVLNLAGRTGLVDELLITVRTVPDDGAERAAWLQRHRRPDAPGLAVQVNDDLHRTLTTAAVRTETFVTVLVGETRLARAARGYGGGLDGRARALHGVMDELAAGLRGSLGASSVDWLTSPDLAVVCRTGFAPGDRATLIAASTPSTAGVEGAVAHAGVPWSQAGPAGADAGVRCWRHDRWLSVSSTLVLPAAGNVVGALAPVLAPAVAGERRCLLVAFPVVPETVADRATAGSEWAADLGDELRARARVKPRARNRVEAAKARGVDHRLAHGHHLLRPYAVATITIPTTAPTGVGSEATHGPGSDGADPGRRLDASIRRAGYAPLRLDLAHDIGFAATCVPLGITLTRA